jgi:hypothetical protein
MSKSNCTKIHPGRDPGPCSVPKCGTHTVWQMVNENDMEWFTPGKSCKKCDTKPFSSFDLLHFYESVFPLIRESLSQAIKRKLAATISVYFRRKNSDISVCFRLLSASMTFVDCSHVF